MKLLIALLVFFTLFGGTYFYLKEKADSRPKNSPATCLEEGFTKKKKVIVAAGDSLTHGQVSANYVNLLEDELPRFNFINAGVNGDRSSDLLARLDTLLKCKPRIIFILIGTNDIRNALNQDTLDDSVKSFKKNYSEILKTLEQSSAKIAVISIPPLGEDLNEPLHIHLKKWNKAIETLATEHGATYIPLYETLNSKLKHKPSTPYDSNKTLMYKAIMKHYLLQKSWDGISEENSFQFLIDGFHLNSQGVNVLALLLKDFVENSITKTY